MSLLDSTKVLDLDCIFFGVGMTVADLVLVPNTAAAEMLANIVLLGLMVIVLAEDKKVLPGVGVGPDLIGVGVLAEVGVGPDLVGVGALIGVGIFVGVGVCVGVGVRVGIGVSVGVGVSVGAGAAVLDFPAVASEKIVQLSPPSGFLPAVCPSPGAAISLPSP